MIYHRKCAILTIDKIIWNYGGNMGFFDKLTQGLSKTKSSFDEKMCIRDR